MKYILIIFLGVIHVNICAQITHSVVFDFDKLKMKDRLLEDGNVYIELEYEDFQANNNVGEPSLPYKYLQFIVPNEPNEFSITINDSVIEVINLSAPLIPVQQPMSTSIKYFNQSFPNNLLINQTTELYPEDVVSIVNEGYFDGNKRILTIRVTPVQYKAFKNQLYFYSSINFTINYKNEQTKENVVKISPIYSVNNSNNTEVMEQLNFVENKSDVNRLITASQTRFVNTDVELNLPVYEYVVITSEILSPYFKRLIDWKRQKGLNAGIVTMQDILSDVSIVKDEVSNLSDDAGKLRQYLRLAYQNGTKYVLLGGGKSIVPIRYGTSGTTSIPTDLYFSDFNGNWNKDGDSYLGEIGEVDYYPEVYVGRILCKSAQEVDNYVDKLLLYEQNPGKGDYEYLRKAFYTQADQMQQARQANIISSDLSDIFSNNTILEELPGYEDENPTFPTGKDVIDAMNETHYGLLSWFNHGSPCGLSPITRGISLYEPLYRNFIGIEGENCSRVKDEVGNGLSNLNNFNYPTIVYTISCSVVPYDTLIENNIIYDVRYNIGEAMTVAGKFGCAAFLGNTRLGWITTSFDLEREFFNKMKLNSWKIGKSEALSKTNTGGGYYGHWVALGHNLIGCPEFEMWTNIPSHFANTSVSKSGDNLIVNSMVDDTNIALRGLFGSNYTSLHTGKVCSFTNVPKNYMITFYKHDYLPYVAPIYLQNESVMGKHYLRGGIIKMGNHVDSAKATGDFIIKSDADIVLDVTNEVMLDAGTTIELGATFEINIK